MLQVLLYLYKRRVWAKQQSTVAVESVDGLTSAHTPLHSLALCLRFFMMKYFNVVRDSNLSPLKHNPKVS